MTDTINLYFMPGSFYSQKGKLCLLEKNVIFEEKIIDMAKNEHLQPDYLKTINSKGQIPVIEHNGKFIPDTEQIYFYMEENFPEPPLIPKSYREEILELHNLIHNVEVVKINLGCIYFPEINGHAEIPKSMLARMTRIVNGDMIKIVESIKDNAPEDAKELYDNKICLLKKRYEGFDKKENVEAVMNKIHDILDKVENKLSKTYGEGLTGCIFGVDTFTIVDIDLMVLLFRLFQLNLNEKFFGQTKRPRTYDYYHLMINRNSIIETIVKPNSK